MGNQASRAGRRPRGSSVVEGLARGSSKFDWMDPLRRLQERLRKVEEQVEKVDQKMEREHQHIVRVMATQRENIQQAFSQINLALLEQEMQYRAFMQATKENLQELRSSLSETTAGLQDLAALFEDHETRLRRLEEGNPPAA